MECVLEAGTVSDGEGNDSAELAARKVNAKVRSMRSTNKELHNTTDGHDRFDHNPRRKRLTDGSHGSWHMAARSACRLSSARRSPPCLRTNQYKTGKQILHFCWPSFALFWNRCARTFATTFLYKNVETPSRDCFLATRLSWTCLLPLKHASKRSKIQQQPTPVPRAGHGGRLARDESTGDAISNWSSAASPLVARAVRTRSKASHQMLTTENVAHALNMLRLPTKRDATTRVEENRRRHEKRSRRRDGRWDERCNSQLTLSDGSHSAESIKGLGYRLLFRRSSKHEHWHNWVQRSKKFRCNAVAHLATVVTMDLSSEAVSGKKQQS